MFYNRASIAKSVRRHLSLMMFALVCPQCLFAVEAGDHVPDLTLPMLVAPGADTQRQTDGTPGNTTLISLSDYLGKVVYLDFWVSSCKPCLVSIPSLSKLHKRYGREDLEILAVNLDSNPRHALRFLASHSVSYPVVSDPSGQVAEAFSLVELPTAFLISRDGVVQVVHRGFQAQDIKTIKNTLTAMIAEHKG